MNYATIRRELRGILDEFETMEFAEQVFTDIGDPKLTHHTLETVTELTEMLLRGATRNHRIAQTVAGVAIFGWAVVVNLVFPGMGFWWGLLAGAPGGVLAVLIYRGTFESLMRRLSVTHTADAAEVSGTAKLERPEA